MMEALKICAVSSVEMTLVAALGMRRVGYEERIRTWWRKNVCSSVKWIYDNTTDGSAHAGIRKAYVNGCRDFILAGLSSAAMDELIQSNGEFAKDMFHAMVPVGNVKK